jgi:hypothetical protein
MLAQQAAASYRLEFAVEATAMSALPPKVDFPIRVVRRPKKADLAKFLQRFCGWRK